MEHNPPVLHPTDYTVSTAVFEGPLDLLLQLIERAELDITSLSLAQVTDQFLAYIHQMAVPAAEISAFLVVAAKLVQIKSEALLPRPPVHDHPEENLGELLARQLRIYKRFKELSAWLEAREKEHLRSYLRLAPPTHVEGHLDLSGVTLTDLKLAAEGIFADEQEKATLNSVITAPRITIREKIAWIAEHLSGDSHARFGALLDKNPTRLEVVVTFLALLELVKRFHVTAHQDGLFSDIFIDKNEDWKLDEDLEIEFE
jgi:segregation and condensation protein A